MTKDTCFLTTKDFTILEVMLDRCLGRDDPLAPILKRKIEAATVMFRDDIPVDVATLSSRVTFSVNGREVTVCSNASGFCSIGSIHPSPLPHPPNAPNGRNWLQPKLVPTEQLDHGLRACSWSLAR